MELLQFLPLVGVALLFYLLIIRPAQKRSRELNRMQSSLDVGDEVVLTAGIHGRVHDLGEDHLFVEIADGVTVKVARGAIGAVRHDQHDDQFDPNDDQPASSESDSAPRAEDT